MCVGGCGRAQSDDLGFKETMYVFIRELGIVRVEL